MNQMVDVARYTPWTGNISTLFHMWLQYIYKSRPGILRVRDSARYTMTMSCLLCRIPCCVLKTTLLDMRYNVFQHAKIPAKRHRFAWWKSTSVVKSFSAMWTIYKLTICDQRHKASFSCRERALRSFHDTCDREIFDREHLHPSRLGALVVGEPTHAT